jgi:hypothetical protein
VDQFRHLQAPASRIRLADKHPLLGIHSDSRYLRKVAGLIDGSPTFGKKPVVWLSFSEVYVRELPVEREKSIADRICEVSISPPTNFTTESACSLMQKGIAVFL